MGGDDWQQQRERESLIQLMEKAADSAIFKVLSVQALLGFTLLFPPSSAECFLVGIELGGGWVSE